MDKNKLALEELYTGHIFDMDDNLTMDEIFERQENQRKRSNKLNDIKDFLNECSIDDYFYVITRIFKDKTPVITVFNDIIFPEKYLDEVLTETRRKKDIKNAIFDIHLSKNSWYCKTLLFNFSSVQQISPLFESVQKCLRDKKISFTNNEITIKDCSISKIIITPESFKIVLNPSKATDYSK